VNVRMSTCGARSRTPTKGSRVALTWIRTHDWDTDAWRNRSLCRDSNPELFFPIGATGIALDQIDAAKEICAVCPVNPECLEFALATNQEAGVWGGTTEEERRKLRKGWLAKQRAS
jgi:WhiB family redox-sensing transcriptional regulator